MKERFWPWKRIIDLERDLDRYKCENREMSEEINRHRRVIDSNNKHMRRRASIIAIKGGVHA